LALVAPTDAIAARLAAQETVIKRLARIEEAQIVSEAPKGAVQIVSGGQAVALPLADIIDIDAEKARLQKEIDRIASEIGKIDKKLANENFVAKAPKSVVEEQSTRRTGYEEEAEKLNAALARLADL
ncbi:MAG: valine--tRNA ligase, partial [Planctomycetota bacterium]